MADTSRYFGIGLDTTQLKKQAEEARKAFSRIGDEAMKQAKVMDQAFSGQIIPPAFEKDIQRLSKLSIDAFGSISDTARKAMTEMQEDILSLSNLEKMMQQLNKSYEDGEIATKDYLNAQARLSVLHEQIADSIRQQEQALKRDSAQMEVAGDSITSMQAKVALLTAEYMKLSEAQRNGMEGEGILKQMSDLQSKLDAAQASMNKFGMAGRTQFNMLGMSMQQLVRELPSLAMGPQMFFLAISNNLPIFTDALAQARKEYQLLTAAGKTAIPVWKQVMKSLLSWQTALSALPAILIMFGPQIAEFFQSFFTGKEKIDSATDALRNIHKELESSNANYGENMVALKSLTDEWGRLSDEASKTKWIEENKSEFDKLGISINDVSDAETAFVDNTDDIIEAFKLRAQAAAAQELAEEKYREAMIKRNKAELEAAKGPSRGDRILSMASTVTGPGISGYQAVGQKVNEKEFFDERVQGLKDEAQAAEDAGDAYFKLYEAKRLESGQMLEGLGLGEQGDDKKRIEETKDYLSQLLDLRRDNEDRQVDLMADGTEKELAEIDLRYKRIRDKVKELETNLTEEQGGKLTPEQLSLFGEAYNQIDRQQVRDRAGVGVDDDTEKRLEAEREAMNRYLKDYGTFQERKKAIADEYNQKIADASTDGDKLILQKQMEEALSDIDMEKLKESINWELVFSDLGNASKKSLQQVKKQLDDFKSSDEYKNMAIDQKKVIDEALNNIQSAIINKGGLLGDLPEQLEELRKAQEELTAAQDEYNEAMKNGTDEQKESAQRKLNKAEQNVTNAQNNTDKAANRTTDNLLTLADALTQLGSNTEMTLSEIGQLAGGIANAFSEAGSKIGGIIGAIFSILDQVGQEGLFGFLGNVFESVGNALTGVFDSLLGWTGIDFGGESDPTLEQDIERLTLANQELEKAINNLTEKMDDAAVADASSSRSR